MKLRPIIAFAMIFSAISCGREEIKIDPIVGTWILIDKTLDGVFVEISECEAQNNLQFLIENNVLENQVFVNRYFIDDITGNCELQSALESWTSGADGLYGIYNGSLFNNNRTLKIENALLYFSFEGWEFTPDGIIVTDVVHIYEKSR